MAHSTNYRTVIQEEFAERRRRNPSYSLRAFARDLKMTYSRLNEVINAKRGISVASAKKLANGLGLNLHETELFLTQVEVSHARSKLVREEAEARLVSLQSKEDESSLLKLDMFAIISQWYHYAILELTLLEDYESDISWIAERLCITKVETELAIGRLLRIGLLEKKKGRWVASQSFTFTPSDIPSMGLKRHHEQILKKASQSVYLQDVKTRDLSAITLAVSKEDLPKAKEMIKVFRRKFMRNMELNPQKDAVYCLGIQFFRMDKSEVTQ